MMYSIAESKADNSIRDFRRKSEPSILGSGECVFGIKCGFKQKRIRKKVAAGQLIFRESLKQRAIALICGLSYCLLLSADCPLL
jgi:hypothetical protein